MLNVKKLFLFSSTLLLTCTPFEQAFSAPLSGSMVADMMAEPSEGKPIERIDVQAENLPKNASFDPRPVLEKLTIKVGDPFSQYVFDTDLKTLSEEYDRIEPQVDVRSGKVFVTLKVWLRPTIRKITWQGNNNIKTNTLKKELDYKEKKTFNRVDFNKRFNKVKEYYVKKGYFESQLSYQIDPVPDTNQVDIIITVVEGRAGIIDDIVFSGFTDEEKSKILEMMYTKKYNFFTSWLTGTGFFHEEATEQDKLVISNLLQNEGYADAKVNIQVTNAEKEGRIVITITADKGALFHFGNVTFSGNTLFTDDKVEQVFLIHPEEVYSPEKIRNTSDRIKELYGRKGYIDTHVDYETELVKDKPIYNVHFDIEEGTQYKIGLVRIFGNERTQSSVILRESLLIPGETFDSAKLKATQERLQNIGYFKNVNVYSVRTQDDQILGENYRDVYIEVEETTTGHASLFFGFSSSDSVFGGLDITETNFNYKGFARLPKQGLSALRGGGEYAHAKATLGSKQRSYLMSWMTPYFRDTLWRVGYEAFLSQSHLEAKKYEIDSVGGSMFASYPLSGYWTAGTRYRVKHTKADVSPGASHKEKREVTKDGTGNISAVSVSLNYDSTDHIVKPHNGMRSYLEAEFSGLGGNFAFLKYSYVNSFYQTLWKNGIMKYRWEAKFIQPIWWTNAPEDIPVGERFYIGGENSVRGYKPFHLGEKFGNGDPKGGVSMSVLSVEYLHEILPILDAFVFVDAGSIALKKFTLPQYQMSYGGGVRISLMNRMPIILGYGVPVNYHHKSQVQRFFFSMGGQF